MNVKAEFLEVQCSHGAKRDRNDSRLGTTTWYRMVSTLLREMLSAHVTRNAMLSNVPVIIFSLHFKDCDNSYDNNTDKLYGVVSKLYPA